MRIEKNQYQKRICLTGVAALLLASSFTTLSAQVFADDNDVSVNDNISDGVLLGAATDEIVDAETDVRTFKYEIHPGELYVTDFLIKPGINSYDDSARFVISFMGISAEHKLTVDVIDEKSGESVYNFEVSQEGALLTEAVNYGWFTSPDLRATYAALLDSDSLYRLKLAVPSGFEDNASGIVVVSNVEHSYTDTYPEIEIIAKTEVLKAVEAIPSYYTSELGNSMTRAQAAEIVYNIFSADKDEFAKTEFTAFGDETKFFTDLDTSNSLHEYIHKLGCAGIVIGDGDGNSRPDDIITENEAITMTVRLLGVGYAHEADEKNYPSGYITAANGLGLLNFVERGSKLPISDYMINLLYAALDIPKSRFDSEKNSVIVSDVTYKYLLQNK